MSVVAVAVCAVFCMLSLAACGNTYARIEGIGAGIATEQGNSFLYDNSLYNKETLVENDYILQVGHSYVLAVTYWATGGSRYPVINAGSVTLVYDSEVLEILSPSENIGAVIYYGLTCKRSVAYTVVFVEVDGKYSDTVIISAI